MNCLKNTDIKYRHKSDSLLNMNEKIFIRENYDYLTDKDLSEILNVPYKNIKGYTGNIKDRNLVRIDRHKKKYLLSNYKFVDNDILLRDTKISLETLNRFVKYYKLEKCKPLHIEEKEHIPNIQKNSNMSKYSIDIDYFNIIDSEHKAYWLGFIFADGCILKDGSFEMSLAGVDKDHIYKFLYDVNCDAKVNRKTVNNKYIAYKMYIKNEKFSESLIKHGCVNNKSLILKFPETVPNNLMKHFIRGYFDGDGCISVNTEKSQPNIRITFTGTKNMLDGIQGFLYKECGLSKTSYEKAGKAYEFGWGGINNMRTFYNYLYTNATIYLDRKYEKFKQAYDYYEKNSLV